MNYQNIQILKNKLLFNVNDAADVFGITHESAWVLCSRYAKQGIFVRLKNNLYTTDINWDNFSGEDFFKISNFIQVPSYISFLTALSYYEISTQVQRNVYENVCLKRTKSIYVKNVTFNYYLVNEKLYYDFIKEKDYFIATPEKAFIDAIYLFSLGRYSLDFAALELNKLNKNKINQLIKAFPIKTQIICKKICKI